MAFAYLEGGENRQANRRKKSNYTLSKSERKLKRRRKIQQGEKS